MLKLKWTRAGLPALLVLVSVGGACAKGKGADDDGLQNQEIPMKLTVQMRGEREVTITDRTVPMRVVTVEGVGSTLQPLFAIQPVDLVEEAGIKVQPGFSITPFKGDGRYTIDPGVPRDDLQGGGDGATPGGTPKSGVRVEWWPPGGEPYEYVRRAQPCTAEIKDHGMKGRLQCPDITHEVAGGPHFSLDLRWEKP
jgi:hypothetical protein